MILSENADSRELPSRIWLFQGLPKSDKMEVILQKAVELGAAGVIPVATRNAVVKLDAKKAEAKIRRWQAIAESAAKQSKRSYIPQVGPVMSLKEAFSYIEEQKFDLRMIPYELEKGMDGTKTVLEALAPGQQVAVFIGPEGGFDEEEIQLALKNGSKTCQSWKAYPAHGNSRTCHTGSSDDEAGRSILMEAYFDNSATTKALDSVRDIMVKTLTEDFGNPSAKHTKGMEAENYIRQAAADIAKTLKVKDKEILFTSGGTESNNMALIGTALANQRAGKHIISTRIEHASVYQPLAFLESLGFEVTYLHVDHNGHISLEELEQSIRPDTILVSVMYVNNEIGAIEPIDEIARLVHGKNPKIVFHVDAIQAYGKLVIRPKKQGIDLLSVSGHKIHGPKGIGFLYIDEKVKIRPLIYGGGQQKDMRSGTENVPGIAGLGVAAKEMYTDHSAKMEYLTGLKDYLIDRASELEGVTVNSLKGAEGAPQIVSLSFEGVRSEVLLHALEEKGIYVSSGSACSSNHPAISGTLKAIGVKKELLDSTLRFSFGMFNKKEEIDYAVDVLKELLPVLRRFTIK